MALVYAQTKPPDTYLSSTVIFPTHPFPHSTNTQSVGWWQHSSRSACLITQSVVSSKPQR